MAHNNQTEQTPSPFKSPCARDQASLADSLPLAPLAKSVAYLKSLQRADGYWWFSLEANETIGAEFIFLMNYLGEVDDGIQQGIARRILDVQRTDGTWALYNDGPADLSTCVECYFALKIAGLGPDHPALAKARRFILQSGGIEKTRVFTRIHLAMFGLLPWTAAAAMPAEYILMPKWTGFSVYEFSSWARATIVPLLIFMSIRRTVRLPAATNLDELFASPPDKRNYSFKSQNGLISWESFFIYVDKCLKLLECIPLKPLRRMALKRCADWTWEHVQKTEDIYPALAYGAMAFKALGYANDSPQIRKPFEALKMFQQCYTTSDVPALPDEIRDDGKTPPSKLRELGISPFVNSPSFDGREREKRRIHQQCCISPVWDTPWAVMALLEAGLPADDPALLRAGRWLLAKQIKDVRGDWAIKNSGAKPGGWSFEFENEYFPDVDDTIEVLHVLHRLAIPPAKKEEACRLGLDWLLSMQNRDGGWGAFDKDQTQTLVNRIPFADHSACLDPSSPDITGRMIEFLASRGFSADHPAVSRALAYIWRAQKPFGGWFARWGINYIYGTWCVLTGLAASGWNMEDPRVSRAADWLESVQDADGGFGESPESYEKKEFVPLRKRAPSQTAWALMGLVAGGRAGSPAARRAAEFLMNGMNGNSSWDETAHTGTGFPGHFYIRYHGYRHFFPLLALARYARAGGSI
ncbi:MAG: terpene cyclase/mutase family protein [Pseudomonadota bacterium]